MALPPITNSAIDIANVLDAQETHQTQLQAITDSLGKLSDEHDFSVNQEVDAIKQEGDLAAAAKTVTDQLTIDKEKRRAAAAAAFGTNMEASNSVIQAMSEGIIAQHEDLKKQGDKILKMREVGFTDDPIEYTINAFALPREVAAYNTREQILERDVKTLQELQNLTQEQIKIEDSISATTNANLSHLESQRLVQAAIIRAENAKQEAMKFGLTALSVRQAVDSAQFNQVLQVHSAQVNLARLQLERDQKNINQEMLALQKKNLQLIIDKREEDEAARTEFQGHLDRATALVGMRRVTTNEWDRLPQKTKEALFDVMSNPNTNSGRLGSDPVDALRNIERINAPLTPNINAVKSKLENTVGTTIGQHPEWTSMKQDQQNLLLRKAIGEQVRKEAGNVPDQGGIYSAPPLASLKGIPAVTATTIWKAALAPRALNPMAPTSAQEIIDVASDFVSTNKMPIEQAAKEVAQIYKSIVVDNAQQRDFNRLALPIQNDYRTNIKLGGISSIAGSQNVDMSNETEVRRILMRLAAQKKTVGEQYGFGHQ